MALMTLASLDELPEGGQLRVELDDLTLLLCHLDGTVYAIDYFCTHDELGLEGGDLNEGCITCPYHGCLLYTSPSPRDQRGSRMPSSA